LKKDFILIITTKLRYSSQNRRNPIFSTAIILSSL